MKIFHYNEFLINEAVVALSNSVLSKLLKVSNLLSAKDKEWVDKIIDISGEDISSDKLDDKNAYYFELTDDPKYFDMEITKPLSSSIQTFKVGRALKIMLPDIPADVLSNIVSALQSEVEGEIKVVEGDEIVKYYTYNDISPEGTIGKSCMNNMDDEFFHLYSENEGIVKMAVLLDEYETLVARALLWKTNVGWVMDRVYYSSDKYQYQFKDWAKSNNYLTKLEMEDEFGVVRIQLDKSDFEFYPYLDTFNYICFNKNQLSNDDIFDRSDEVSNLNGTDGGFEVLRNVELPFNPIHSLSEYKWARDLTTFINYSIDYERWLDDFISDELEQYYSYPKEFLDVYDGYIKYNFDKLNLKEIDKDIDKDNFKEMILDFHNSYMSEYEDIIKKVIELRYSKEEGYVSWIDISSCLYGGDIGSYQSLGKWEKEYYDNFISRYCKLEILNKKLKELYTSNYDNYQRIMYKVSGY